MCSLLPPPLSFFAFFTLLAFFTANFLRWHFREDLRRRGGASWRGFAATGQKA